MFTEAVVGFISEQVERIVPKRTIRTFPNQKPWVDKSVRDALNSRTAAYNAGIESGNMDDYKAATYNVRKVVREAKQRYGAKLESQLESNNTRDLWKGLRNITDYKASSAPITNTDIGLANELNTFFARFEDETRPVSMPLVGEEMGELGLPFQVTEHDVRCLFKRMNIRKSAGPDGITGRILKVCADQLAPVFTTIFNMSLSLSVIPSCFKQSIIVPVPKKPKPNCPNDYRPIALTSEVMKCFERLVKNYITSCLPASLDPLQFAYRPNRSTDDAIAYILHTIISHVDKQKGTYVRMLFVDYSSAFNTIIPSILITKLKDLGLAPGLCKWVLNFLTDRSQVVRLGQNISSPLVLNTGAPQGCVLSPLLYSLYTHDCKATFDSNVIVKFADDTAVVGLISNNNEEAYLQEINQLVTWCQGNRLELNVSKTKELIVDFSRKQQRNYTPISIAGTEVERVDCFKYLGVHITEDLTWARHTNSLVKKARQRLYHLRRLRDFKLPERVLRNFYTSTIESILSGCITTWMGSSNKKDYLALRRVVHSAERTIRCSLPDLRDIYSQRCRSKANKIIKEPSHPANHLFSLLPSGKRYRSIKARTNRMRNSFYPKAIRLLNMNST